MSKKKITTSPIEEVVVKKTTENRETVASESALPFGKSNYTVMLLGIGFILAGFFIMTLDKEEFGFGFMGLTLGPVIAFIGFIIEFYAILKKK